MTRKRQHLTGVWQKWRFRAPQTVLWLIKVWFSASTFVVKIATFAKPQTVIGYSMATVQPSTDSAKNEQTVTQNRTKKPYLRYEHLIQYG